MERVEATPDGEVQDNNLITGRIFYELDPAGNPDKVKVQFELDIDD
jgi:hypothetical protein